MLTAFSLAGTAAYGQTPPPQEFALEFHVDHAASAQLALQNEFTMEVWILPKVLLRNPFLGNSGMPSGQGISYILRLNDAGNVEFYQASATTDANLTSAQPIPLRQWTHVAAVVGGGMARFYLNGQEAGSTESLGPPDNSLPFVVGTQLMDFGLCCGVSAAFRQVRVWNRALSAAEVQLMMGATLTGNEPGLVAYWPLDDGIGLQPRNLVAAGPALLLGWLPEPDTRDPRWARTTILENGPFFTQESYQVPNLGPLHLGNGVLVDFDHDGDLDVILHSGDPSKLQEFLPYPLFALRNDGTGHFSEDSASVFAGQSIDIIGINFDAYQARDFNGDGLTDLFVAGHGPDGPLPGAPNPLGEQSRLLIQTAGGQLFDETASRLPSIIGVGHNSASGDADDDGDIDLFTPDVCCGAPSHLDINDGTGHFTNQTSRLSPQIPAGCGPQSAVFFDADHDSDEDLLVGEACSDLDERDLLYINDSAGNLVRTPKQAIPVHPFLATTLGVDAGDFDGDGWVDLVEIMRTQDPAHPNPPGGHFDRLRLLLNNRDGTFRDATQRIPQTWEHLLDFGINNLHVVDVNLDDKLDIVLEGDHGTTRQRLFLNAGEAFFLDVTELLPQDAPCGDCQPGLPVVESLLPGDLDGDEDIDFFANVGQRFFVVRNVKPLITALTDLALTVTDSPDPVAAGGSLTFTAAVFNNGPDDATSTRLLYQLPAGVEFISVTPSQGSCTSGPTVTCELGGIASGAGASVEITVSALANGTLANTLVIINSTGVESDPDFANNLATVATVVEGPPVANDDFFTVTANSSNNVFDVLANDVDNDPLTLTLVGEPDRGGSAAGMNGFISYTPAAGFTGVETFIYEVCDPVPLCDSATVTVTVEGDGPPEPPPGTPTGQFLLADRTAASVRTFNASDNAEVGSARAGVSPDHVVVSPNGRLAFVANLNANYISVADLTLGVEITRIRNLRSRHMALNSSGTRLVVPVLGRDQVAIIDTSDFSILQVVSLDGLGGDTVGVADILPQAVVVVASQAYVNPAVAGRPVFIIDITTFAVTTTAPILGGATSSDTIAATPDGNFVLAFRTGLGVNRRAMIDTATNAVTIFSTPFPIWAVAVTSDAADPDGVFAYVVTGGIPNLRVQVIDLNPASLTFGQLVPGAEAQLPLVNAPIVNVEIALTADSNAAYVVPDLTNVSPNMAVVKTALLLTTPASAVSGRTINAIRLTGVATASVPAVPSATAPQVTDVTPTLVINGTASTVRVFGANFDVDARVRIGSRDPVPATVLSSGELEVTIPAGTAAQGAAVIVTNPNPLGPLSDQHLSGILLDRLVVASPPTFQPAHQVLVANFGDGSLSVLNTSTNTTVAPSIPVGHELLGVAASPDGARAFTLSFNPPVANVFDNVNRAVEASLPFGSPGSVAGQARGVGSALYPPTETPAVFFVEGVSAGTSVFDERLRIVDAAPPFSTLLTISANLTDGGSLRGGLAVTPDGRYVYHNGFVGAGVMIVFDVVAQSAHVRTTSSLGVAGFQAIPNVSSDGSWLMLQAPGGGPLKLFDIANDPLLTSPAFATVTGMPPAGVSAVTLVSAVVSGNRLFAFDSVRNVVYVFNFDPATPDFSQLAAFPIPSLPSLFGSEIIIVPDGSLLYAVLREDDAVAVLDAAQLIAGAPGVLLTTVGTGLAPTTLAFRPGLATPTGANVSVQPISEVMIAFNNVTGAGATSVTTTNTNPLPVPAGFQLGDPPIFFEITTTASFTGPIEVCFSYDENQFNGAEADLRVLHEEGGSFVDRTSSLDTANNVICAVVDSFSAFVAGLGSVNFLFDGLLDDIADAVAHDGIRRSLQAKALAARSALDRGDSGAAANALEALRLEIQSQTGKHLTELDAERLLSQVGTLMSRL
ncbi:MAG: LamG-like jellyroll fold domain-containing protein [Candidatus Acidiferrales bacterium]